MKAYTKLPRALSSTAGLKEKVKQLAGQPSLSAQDTNFLVDSLAESKLKSVSGRIAKLLTDRTAGNQIPADKRLSVFEALQDFSIARKQAQKKAKALFALGTAAAGGVVGGAAFGFRQEIIQVVWDKAINSPSAVDSAEREDAPKSAVPLTMGQVQLRASNSADFSKGCEGQVQLGNLKIDLLDSPYFTHNDVHDSGHAIQVQDPYLQNLLSPQYVWLDNAKNPFAWKTWVGAQRDSYQSSSGKLLGDGEVASFLAMTQKVLKENVKFDPGPSSWIYVKPSGLPELKWGTGNPFAAQQSADGTPIDVLMTEKHLGACRHQAEAFCRTLDEAKLLYPDRYQNIYAVPWNNDYLCHTYVAIFQVVSPEQARMWMFDPTHHEWRSGTTYDLLRAAYYRKIIPEERFFHLVKDYALQGGHLLPVDARGFCSVALLRDCPEATVAAGTILQQAVRSFETANASSRSDTPNGIPTTRAAFMDDYGTLLAGYEQKTGQDLSPPKAPS